MSNFYVVLHQDSDGDVNVLGVYKDEERANRSVSIERAMTDDNVWYQDGPLFD